MFSGYVCRKEALAAAFGENCKKIQLILNVSEVCLSLIKLIVSCHIFVT